MTVDIILATFNGARHIDLQLASLVSQTFIDWRLLVSDDGSTDETLAIVERYAAVDSRIHIVTRRAPGAGLGPALNFLNLLANSTSDFAIFCDQDDVWFETKLAALHAEIVAVSQRCKGAAMVFAQGYHYFENTSSINGLTNLNYPRQLSDFLFLNGGIQGCSMILNRELITLARRYSAKVAMHDHYISLLAYTFGTVARLSAPLMLYRHHSKNVTVSLGGGVLRKMHHHLFRRNFLVDRPHFEAVRSFYLAVKDDLAPEVRNVLLAYLNLHKVPRLIWPYLALKYKFSINGSILFCLYKMLFGEYVRNESHMKLRKWQVRNLLSRGGEGLKPCYRTDEIEICAHEIR